MARQLPAGVRELEDGTFRVRRQVRGNRQDRRAHTYDEAMALYREMFADNIRSAAPDRRLTLGRYLLHYVDGREDLAASSRRSFLSLIRNYVEAAPIARVRLVDLTEDDVVLFLRNLRKRSGERTGRPLSAQTVAQVRKLLSAALTHAERTGRITRNPVRLAKGPKVIRQAIQPPTIGELRMIRDHVHDHPLAALYAVLMQTGLRLGEALALRWRDLELDGARASVCGSLDEATGIRREHAKTSSSHRTVALPASTVLALRGRRVVQDEHKRRVGRVWADRDGLVFTSRTGHPLNGKNLRRHLARVAAESGAAASRQARGVGPVLRWHDFRHAWATMALEAGLPLHAVSQLLGHNSIKTTADVYGHLTDAMREEAAQRVARAIG